MKRLTLLTAIALAVSACAQTVDTFCLNYTPIVYSASQDSAETKAQIKEQNAVWTRICR